MNAVERLRDALKVGKKTRGRRVPVYNPDGNLKGHAREHIEIIAGDVIEACDQAIDPRDEIVRALRMGSAAGHPERKVIIQADDLFHLVDQVKPSDPVKPVEKKPKPEPAKG